MKTTDEFIGLLEDYLDNFEGSTPLPDGVRDAVLAKVSYTNQIRPRGAMRILTMATQIPRPARYGLVAAVAVVALLLGSGLLNRNPGVAPTPTPQPTPSPSSGESLLGLAHTVPSPYGSDHFPNIVAGRYYLPDSYPAHITLDVPSGWRLWHAQTDFYGLLVDSPGTSASGWGVSFAVVGSGVSVDPCDPTKDQFSRAVGRSVDDLALAMSGWPGFEVVRRSETAMSGHRTLVIELRSTLEDADCPSPLLWKSREALWPEEAYGTVGSHRVATYRLVQLNDAVLAIFTAEYPETSPLEIDQGIPMSSDRHADDLAGLRAMLDSITITDR